MNGRRWGWYPDTLLFGLSREIRLLLSMYRVCIVVVNDGLSGLHAPSMDNLAEETATKKYGPTGTRIRKPKSLEQYGVSVKGGFAFICLFRECAP